MTNEELKNILKTGATELGITVGDEQATLFLKYLSELKDWNKKINLTAITDEKDIIIRHFLDSLTLATFLAHQKILLDIGSGAGFPGIPLKIIFPNLQVMVMDSVNKKVVFMKHIIRMLGLKQIEALHARADDKAIIKKFGLSFDAVTSRAFAELGKFLEIALPYAKQGGLFLALKGPKGVQEARTLQPLRGIEYVETKEIRLPFTDMINTILVFKKG